MSMPSPVKNTTDSPQVIDDDGHIIGGGEWADVDVNSDRVKELVDAGLLVPGTGPESASSAAAEEPADEAPVPSTGSKAHAKKETS